MSETATLARQRERIDELEETIRQLRGTLAPMVCFPVEWRLRQQEARFLSGLLASPGAVSRERMMSAFYGSEIKAERDPKILDVVLVKLRKKLPPGIGIETVWGQGWTLSRESRQALTEAVRAASSKEEDSMPHFTISLDDKVHARIVEGARAAGTTGTAYARMLLEAAYAARYGETGDRDLDATVAAALILSGAELDMDKIARALRVSEATVARIRAAWSEHAAAERREAA